MSGKPPDSPGRGPQTEEERNDDTPGRGPPATPPGQDKPRPDNTLPEPEPEQPVVNPLKP